MATAAKIIDAPSTDIAVVVARTPAVVLVDREKCEELYAHIQREVDAFEPDLTTAKGRDAIKSLAFKITRTKTAIDAAGKQLNEDARAQINAVDAARRDAREKLDAMAKAVRQPLTDWEAAEEERVAWCNQVIADLKAGAVVTMDDTAETVRARGKAAWEVIIKPETFGELFDTAQSVKDTTVGLLKSALERLTKEEADRAELEKLRAEAAERERVEAERIAAEEAAQAVREAAERAEAEQRAAEERRIAAEKAEAERIERAAKEAEERARREAEQTAQAERERVQREHDEALAAERRRAEQAEADALAERLRIANEAAAEKAKREAEIAEQTRREKNRAHRAQIMGEAKIAIMAAGSIEATAAEAIVRAIVKEVIPHVTLRF